MEATTRKCPLIVMKADGICETCGQQVYVKIRRIGRQRIEQRIYTHVAPKARKAR